MAKKRLIVAALGLGLLSFVRPAKAWSSASSTGALFHERYLVCSDPLSPQCAGASVAKNALLEAVAIDPENVRTEPVISRYDEAAHFIAAFGITEAIPRLRRALDITIAPNERGTHRAISKNRMRAEAAHTLSILGDTSSVPKIEAIVRDLETTGSGSLWSDTLAALGRLDVPAAGRYATDFLGRQTLKDFGMSMPGGSSRDVVLRWVVAAKDKNALPALKKITTPENVPMSLSASWCKLTAARIALGDEPLVTDAKKMLTKNTSGTWAATCDSAWLGALPLGEKDAGIFVRWLGRDDLGMDYGTANVAYRRLLELLASFAERHRQRQGSVSPAEITAKAEIKKALVERSAWPHVADPTHRHHSKHWVAMHYAALASMGDPEAQRKLWDVVDDLKDPGGAAFLGAFWALALQLPDAVDHAVALLVRSTRFESHERSGIFSGIRERLIDTLIAEAPDDLRWTVALADADRDVREHAIVRVSRWPKAIEAACDSVTSAAPDATKRGVEGAFFALGSFNACRSRFERIARDPRAPSKVRGMAFEMLATMGSPTVMQSADEVISQTNMAPYVERAKAIVSATTAQSQRKRR